MSEFIHNASMENNLSNIARSVHDITMDGKGVLKDINNQLGAITVELRRINAMNEEKEDGEKLLTNLYCFLALEHNFQKSMDGEILTAKECYDRYKERRNNMADILMSADEARRKTREHGKEVLKNNLDLINKAIDKACHCGAAWVTIHENYIDNKIADILRESGYFIEYDQMEGNFKISWYEEDEE